MNKKGQIQIGENIAILFIFILLVIGAIVFYSRIQRADFEIKGEEERDKEFVQIAQKVSFLPELRCSQENVPTENCIDKMKLDKFVELVGNNYLYYENDFKTSTIVLEQIYPDTGERWELYNNTGDKESAIPAYIPISIFNSTDGVLGSYYFGVLIVQVWR